MVFFCCMFSLYIYIFVCLFVLLLLLTVLTDVYNAVQDAYVSMGKFATVSSFPRVTHNTMCKLAVNVSYT